MWVRRRGGVALRLLWGASAAAVATAATAAFEPLLAQSIFLVFLAATLTSALWGGISAGLAASLGSTLGLAYAIFDPRGLPVDALGDRIRLMVFCAFGVLVSVLSEALRNARRRAAERERALRESEESYRSLFTHSAEALYLLDRHGRFVEANPEALRMYGVERDALVGRSPTDFTPEGLADPAEARQRIAAALAGEPQRFPWWGRRVSGEVFPMEVALGRARYLGEEIVIAATRDMTESHRLELQLRQAQKMEVVGRLTSGVAHDFNNILTAIRGRASLLAEQIPAGDPLREDVEEIDQAAELAATVTRQLLEFGRQRDPGNPRLVSLGAVVRGVEIMLRRILGERITLVTALSPEPDRVRADPGQLEQVVLNLVVNARDAMPDGGTITISTGPRRGGQVELVVQDTGVGMDEATMARLFEPFFTTKALGRGTGLGLSTAHAIVQRHGGRIGVRSEPGRGATFEIILPAAAGGATAVADPPTPAAGISGAAEGAGETVLLVEDEEPVRSMVRKILRRHGYRVIEARDGVEARAAWSADPADVQLVISDIGLPDIDGRALAAELQAKRPDVPVILASGYDLEEPVSATGRSRTDFVPKPFTPGQLLGAVRDALREAASRAA